MLFQNFTYFHFIDVVYILNFEMKFNRTPKPSAETV